MTSWDGGDSDREMTRTCRENWRGRWRRRWGRLSHSKSERVRGVDGVLLAVVAGARRWPKREGSGNEEEGRACPRRLQPHVMVVHPPAPVGRHRGASSIGATRAVHCCIGQGMLHTCIVRPPPPRLCRLLPPLSRGHRQRERRYWSARCFNNLRWEWGDREREEGGRVEGLTSRPTCQVYAIA